MDHIFYLMGKSSSGKDTIYRRILAETELTPVILYTTRPVREGEQDGREYHFVDEDRFREMLGSGSIIEYRVYDTVYGDWIYFTAADSVSLGKGSCIGIGTLESYLKLRDYFGEDVVVPVYIEVDDDIRFLRAVEREKSQKKPKYLELCRRFVSDSADFSEEKLAEAGISVRFANNGAPEECTERIKRYISEIK
nr:guanylate kinase [Ruminococcus flavefaciens]